jgi:hypothetical protein
MKTFSERGGPAAPDRATAWACLLTNALTLPGLGSIAGGRSAGYAQGGLALVGFGLSLYWLVKTLLAWMAEGQLPVEINRTLLIGLGGIAIYAGAWLWALATSLALLREAKAGERAAGRKAGQAP